ncbi:MAG TPA: hypothetical protein VN754_13385, partial [Candidatus Binataceae bacterium]|nr:hypothetical protein [Candidatus Binataceae bacterium]
IRRPRADSANSRRSDSTSGSSGIADQHPANRLPKKEFSQPATAPNGGEDWEEQRVFAQDVESIIPVKLK